MNKDIFFKVLVYVAVILLILFDYLVNIYPFEYIRSCKILMPRCR